MKKILIINDLIQLSWWAENAIYQTKKILEKEWNIVNIYWTSDNKQTLFSFFKSFFSIKYFISTKKIIDELKPDIIHFHNLSRHISISPILSLLSFKKIKRIMTLHDFIYYCPRTWWINNKNNICTKWFSYKCYLLNCKSNRNWINNIVFNFLRALKINFHRIIIKRNIDTFICPSKKLQEYIIKSLNIAKEKVVYIPNFIKIDKEYYPNFWNIDENKFLFVWRLSKEKWINIAIEAFDILVNINWITDLYFEIIWDGPEKYSLKKLVTSLWLEKNIKFLWKIDNENLKINYISSLWLIMPSIWLENNPLVALEWMKFWKPILASNIWGYPDLVEDWKNWYLFSMWNALDLSKKINNLYKNKKLSINMWTYWFEKLKKEFNSELFYEKLSKIYNL